MKHEQRHEFIQRLAMAFIKNNHGMWKSASEEDRVAAREVVLSMCFNGEISAPIVTAKTPAKPRRIGHYGKKASSSATF